MRKNNVLLLFLIIFLMNCFLNAAFATVENNKYRLIDKFLGTPIPEDKQDIFFQVSTIDAVEKGYYENFENKNSINKKYGDFGIGLIRNNSGVILYDTEYSYIVKNFQAVKAERAEYTPVSFGIFKYFDTDDRITLKETKDILSLKKTLDEKLETVNHFVAFKSIGKFEKVILEDINGNTNELTNAKGDLIGFRMPCFMEKSVPVGYTIYFISDNKAIAGKVKEIEASLISFSVDYSNQLQVILPKNKNFKVKDFAEYKPKEKLIVKEKQHNQKDMQTIMNTGVGEQPLEKIMQMFAPKMQF